MGGIGSVAAAADEEGVADGVVGGDIGEAEADSRGDPIGNGADVHAVDAAMIARQEIARGLIALPDGPTGGLVTGRRLLIGP